MSSFSRGALVALLLLSVSCQDKKEAPEVSATPEAPAEAASAAPMNNQVEAQPVKPEFAPLDNPTAQDLERGARVYKANCLRCHNADPNVKGSIGPEQVDAPFEVVVSKIMTGKYPDPLPAGFTPKRKTRAMTPLRQLKGDIPYIYAWIQSVKKK